MAQDYVANNLWHMEQQSKRLRSMADALRKEADDLEESVALARLAHREEDGGALDA